MSEAPPLPARQSRLTDDFFYFFLRLRKDRVRKVVADINQRYPEEALEQRARRLIAAQAQLSLLGGLILDLPTMIPVIGHAMKVLGFVGGTSALVRCTSTSSWRSPCCTARISRMRRGFRRWRRWWPAPAWRSARPLWPRFGVPSAGRHGHRGGGGLDHVPLDRRKRHPLLQSAAGGCQPTGSRTSRGRAVGLKSFSTRRPAAAASKPNFTLSSATFSTNLFSSASSAPGLITPRRSSRSRKASAISSARSR